VPWLDPAAIMKALDAGAMQIICPMINTPEQAAEFVSYLRYPPVGQRSFGPTRAAFAQGANIHVEANTEVVGWAMVETKEAMANLDAIASTPGLDGIYVGPADLTFSLCDGKYPPGFDREEPEMIDALQTIVRTCRKHGIKAALHCGTAEYAAKAIGWGYDMTTVSGDTRLLAGAAAASVKMFREAILNAAVSEPEVKGGY
jgi:4-hydroxy-2-oxoheptanedioate aldolase